VLASAVRQPEVTAETAALQSQNDNRGFMFALLWPLSTAAVVSLRADLGGVALPDYVVQPQKIGCRLTGDWKSSLRIRLAREGSAEAKKAKKS